MPIPLSVVLFSVRDHLAAEGFRATLDALAGIGYLGVECGDAACVDAFGDGPAAFRALVQDCGLAISGYHCHRGVAADAGTADAVAARVEALGLDEVVLPWTAPEHYRSRETLARYAEELAGCCAALRTRGVGLVVHNHGHEVAPIDGRPGLSWLAEWIPELRFQLDTYWAARMGAADPTVILRELRRRCSSLHIKDGPLREGGAHVAVGAGAMDVPGVIACADAAVTRWLAVELDRCDGDSMAAVAESHAYLVGHGLAAGRPRATATGDCDGRQPR